jgi:phosphate uptake regulator
MGRFARAEVVQSAAALAGRDVALAENLAAQDRDINRLNREIFRMAVEAGDDYDIREWSMHMTLVAARSSASATTPWTSASRSPSWSPGCSASSRTSVAS